MGTVLHLKASQSDCRPRCERLTLLAAQHNHGALSYSKQLAELQACEQTRVHPQTCSSFGGLGFSQDNLPFFALRLQPV